MPVEVLGLNQLPQSGDTFLAVENEREGRLLVEQRQREENAPRTGVTLEEMVTQIRMGEAKELFLVVKADVQGSVEAIRDALVQLNTEETQVTIIHAASGAVTEGDVFLAAASKAIILGFNTRLEVGAHQAAEQAGVEVRLYNIIYNLLEDVRGTLEGLIEPTAVEVVEGHATVRAIFSQGRRGKIAGVYVTDGRVVRNGMARVLRGGWPRMPPHGHARGVAESPRASGGAPTWAPGPRLRTLPRGPPKETAAPLRPPAATSP